MIMPHSSTVAPFQRLPSASRRPRPARSGACVALLDDRFVAWLSHGDCEPGAEPAVSRRTLVRALSRLLSEFGLDVSIKRVYWYTDRPDGEFHDDQIIRVVGGSDEPDGSDDASEAWQLIERDLKQLSEWQACEHLLLATDDERLVGSIDQAQLRGLSVYLMADEASQQAAALRDEDPDWARLLAQADRRIVVRADDLLELRQPDLRSAAGDHARSDIGADQRTTIEEVVRAWWDAQSVDSQEDLRGVLASSPGIPQEVDRALLLQTRERFVRPLSFSEKKIMRERLRAMASGSGSDEALQAD